MDPRRSRSHPSAVNREYGIGLRLTAAAVLLKKSQPGCGDFKLLPTNPFQSTKKRDRESSRPALAVIN